MIKKIAHIFLSFLMLLATVGITVSKHYCGNNVQYHLFIDESCDMESMPANSAHENCNMGEDCCHTEIESLQFHTDYVQENKLEINTGFSFVLFFTACAYQESNISVDLQNSSLQIILPIFKEYAQSTLQVFRC